MNDPLSWEHTLREIPESGLTQQREAAPEERTAVASALDLVACRSLAVTYTVMPGSAGRHVLAGRLRAEITQTCVVTLVPVDGIVEEAFEVSFWPAEEVSTRASGLVDIEDEADPEPIVEGKIAAGRIVFECLAAAIDPYPKAPGASLEWQPPSVAVAADNPFAVLAKIKKP